MPEYQYLRRQNLHCAIMISMKSYDALRQVIEAVAPFRLEERDEPRGDRQQEKGGEPDDYQIEEDVSGELI